jgi:hypothetical protein
MMDLREISSEDESGRNSLLFSPVRVLIFVVIKLQDELRIT